MGLRQYSLRETGEPPRLFPVPQQVLGQQVAERAQCLLLEHQPLWLEQTLGDGGLELPTSTQLKLRRRVNSRHLIRGLPRQKYSDLIGQMTPRLKKHFQYLVYDQFVLKGNRVVALIGFICHGMISEYTAFLILRHLDDYFTHFIISYIFLQCGLCVQHLPAWPLTVDVWRLEFLPSSFSVCFFFSWRLKRSEVSSCRRSSICKSLKTQKYKHVEFTKHFYVLAITRSGLTAKIIKLILVQMVTRRHSGTILPQHASLPFLYLHFFM